MAEKLLTKRIAKFSSDLAVSAPAPLDDREDRRAGTDGRLLASIESTATSAPDSRPTESPSLTAPRTPNRR